MGETVDSVYPKVDYLVELIKQKDRGVNFTKRTSDARFARFRSVEGT